MTIQIHPDVYDAVQFIRNSNRVDMFDRRKVAYLCREIGYTEAALWIEEHADYYLRGVLGGFESLKQVK